MKTTGATSSWICRRYIIVMKQRLEPVVVHDAADATEPPRDAVGALLDPARRFGIDRGTVAHPLHDGVQVCQDLRRCRRVRFRRCSSPLAQFPRLFGAISWEDFL